MKFEVSRTSGYFGREDDRPCDEATLDREEKDATECRIAHWTVEIESLEGLMAFCNKYGRIVIEPDKPLPWLEIYDSYRE